MRFGAKVEEETSPSPAGPAEDFPAGSGWAAGVPTGYFVYAGLALGETVRPRFHKGAPKHVLMQQNELREKYYETIWLIKQARKGGGRKAGRGRPSLCLPTIQPLGCSSCPEGKGAAKRFGFAGDQKD